MASPLRFRRSQGRWDLDRVLHDVLRPLDANLGASISRPRYEPDGYEARRLDMDNGDLALFAWNDDGAYWLGNTETPETLWHTDKESFEEVPDAISDWAQRELLDDLVDESPWISQYTYVAWFFLPVLLSKDGRETTREFFRDHAAGFPDSTRDEVLSFYNDFLRTGALHEHRYTMASKLGTSEALDLTRMSATMSEFNVAKILHDAGYEVRPEVEVSTGHSLDFDAGGWHVEVTRPLPPSQRSASTAVRAVRETAGTKSSGQLKENEAVLFVDCSGFGDDDWNEVVAREPNVSHTPAVVFRMRPTGRVEGYTKGEVPLEIEVS